MKRAGMSSLIPRDLERDYPIIVRGEGIYLYDERGKKYIDGSSGSSAVANLGHGVEEIIEAMQTESRKFAYSPSHCFLNQPSIDLAELLSSITPKGLNKIWFVCDGSEATENAVKLVRQYQIERGYPSKSLVICRWQAYHGNTLGSLGFGGHTFRRRKYLPLFINSPHIPPAYCYRCYFEKTYPECGVLCARSLETMIRQQGSENVAAFIAEPIVGASLGAVPPVDEYFGIIREICDKYDVLFIADEVMTGLGRTGQMFGMDLWKVKPDMMSLAKGLSAGYLPLGAVAVREEILELLKKKKSNIASGHTFSAHHITAAVGIAAVQYLLKNDLVSKSRENGAYLLKKLEKLLKHPIVGDVRGRGLFAGIELVKNKKTKQPFPSAEQIAARIGAETLKRGLVSYPGTGSVDGVSGDHIFLAPPLIITKPQIDDMLSILDESIGEVEKKVR